MLHPLTRRFLDAETERRYREAFIDGDRRQASITAGVLLVPLIGFFLTDLGFFSASSVPVNLLLARLGIISLTLALIARLRWPMAPAAFDGTVSCWWVLLAAFILFVNGTRPPGYLLHNAIDAAVLIVVFVMPPITIQLQALPALMLAFGNLTEAVTVRDLVGNAPLIVLPVTYVMVLVIGYTTAWRLHGMRREQWAAMQQQLALQQRLEELANTDALTGVLNRRQFLLLADAEFPRAVRHRRPLAMLMLDIDHFKRINDSWGHATGDTALVEVARALTRELRAHDRFARMGGEEFAILMPETPPVEAARVAERLRESCAELMWHPEHGSTRLTLSIGVAQLEAADTAIEELLRRADRALYDAKHAGRNRVVAR